MIAISLLGRVLIIFHICLCENLVFRTDEPPKPGFGEYTVAVQKFDDCTEKIEDEIIAKGFKLNHIFHNTDSDEFILTMNLKKKYKMVKLENSLYLWKYGKFTKVSDKSESNPCTGLIGRKLLILEGILDESQCILNSGNFSSSVIRPNELGHRILGNHFFYGLIRISIKFYAEKGLGFCMDAYVVMKPKSLKIK